MEVLNMHSCYKQIFTEMPNPFYTDMPRSREQYERVYSAFEKEMRRLQITDYDEGLIRVFEEWSSRYKASTLSTKLSAIKTVIKARQIPINSMTLERIQSCISHQKKADPQTKKASVFTRDDLITYLRLDHHNRPDYLIRKVMMIIGFCCLPRGEEMRGISLDHIRVLVK